jgi:hypothetical protein
MEQQLLRLYIYMEGGIPPPISTSAIGGSSLGCFAPSFLINIDNIFFELITAP